MKFYIREAREKAGLTQKELAAIVGVHPSTFNGYEKGNHDPKSDLLAKIADACGVTVDYLLGKSERPTPVPENEPISSNRQALLDAIKSMDEETANAVLDIIRSVKRLRGE